MSNPRRTLSSALRRGLAAAPLRLHGRYYDPTTGAADALGCVFLGSIRGAPESSEPEFITSLLLRLHPQLWGSVRLHPRLAAEIEAEAPRVVPAARRFSSVYRQAIHPSLFRVIADLDDTPEWTRERIADLLERHGL